MRRYINLSNLFCIIDKKLVLPQDPFLSDLDLHRETRRINIIRAFVGVARVNIFMRIYTRLLYVPSNKMSRAVNISREREGQKGETLLFSLCIRDARSLCLWWASRRQPSAKTGRGEQCEYITVFDAKTKNQAALSFVLYEGVISRCDTANHIPRLTEIDSSSTKIVAQKKFSLNVISY